MNPIFNDNTNYQHKYLASLEEQLELLKAQVIDKEEQIKQLKMSMFPEDTQIIVTAENIYGCEVEFILADNEPTIKIGDEVYICSYFNEPIIRKVLDIRKVLKADIEDGYKLDGHWLSNAYVDYDKACVEWPPHPGTF